MQIKINPNHVRLANLTDLTEIPLFGKYKESDYNFSLEIPHFINNHIPGISTAIIKSGSVLNTGDEITDEYAWKANITEIIERRKARGNWTKNTYDKSPDFVRFKYN